MDLKTYRLTPTRGQSALHLLRLLADAHLPTRLSSLVAILVVHLINTCARELTGTFAKYMCRPYYPHDVAPIVDNQG